MDEKTIPYGKQSITESDIKAVQEVLRSDYLTQGPKIEEFEKKFSRYIGADYAVAIANGTAALHVSTLSLKVKPGDKVITSPITFSASANCVRYCGGEVFFVDIDPETYLMDINKLSDLLEKYPKGTFTGIIPVDITGLPINLEEIKHLADEYNLWIIEDACHAPGGYFVDSKGTKQFCGDGNFADLAIFSFHPVKHIATGEGGMVTTNRKDLKKRLALLRTHGITKDPGMIHENHGGWYYEMLELGYNYRLSDIHAALGISQLKRIDENIRIRRNIAQRYQEAFQNSEIKTPFVPEDHFHVYHLYVIKVNDRLGLYNHLRRNNIYPQVHYIPVHLLPYYRNLGWGKNDFPFAENYYDHCLSLPMYPDLTDDQQQFVIEKVIEFIR